ncbi:MAG: glycoside hydrolase family 27 protein [Bacteroidales bacterium]|nr:glycoside hydrolase family 27 protein [Bacteroidales bacterium]
MRRIVLAAVAVVSSLAVNAQKFENMAPTPPMGWNSWNYFACNVDEKMIREVADIMAESGMQDAGYEYINIDDCWHGTRDSLGFIHPDPQRFPSGMKALADYVHSKGLKLGIYSDAGWKTCGGRPGSRGHEYQDAMMYASWGIDYLKYDWCFTDGLKAEGAYLTMRNALYAAGRPMVLSICEWGDNQPWIWGDSIGHLWRTTGDIYHCFDCVIDHKTWNQWGVLQILDLRDNSELRKHAGPNHWNDPDMMEVGNGMTVSEDRAHFSMWCMLAAPLIAGNDIRNMTPEVKTILTNAEAIAVDQDRMGVQGLKFASENGVDVWYKPLEGGDWAVCFLNRDTIDKKMSYKWFDQKVVDDVAKRSTDFLTVNYTLRDLWAHKNLGDTRKALDFTLPGHDVLMLRLSPVKK